MFLQTNLPDCCLRSWKAEDKPALLRHANNRKVWRNLTEMFPHPYTEADVDDWVSIANQSASTTHTAIELEEEAKGSIGVIAREGISCRTGHFGYWLGEAHWGHGIATAAARAMVAHLSTHSQFARLEAPVFGWNPASMRVLEKARPVREGVLKRSVFKDGQLIDSVLFALILRDA